MAVCSDPATGCAVLTAVRLRPNVQPPRAPDRPNAARFSHLPSAFAKTGEAAETARTCLRTRFSSAHGCVWSCGGRLQPLGFRQEVLEDTVGWRWPDLNFNDF